VRNIISEHQDEEGGPSQENGRILAADLQWPGQVNFPITAPGEHGEVDASRQVQGAQEKLTDHLSEEFDSQAAARERTQGPGQAQRLKSYPFYH
jgi:hypothetical protein